LFDAIGLIIDAAERRGAGSSGRDMPEVRRPSKWDARTRMAPRLLYVVAEDSDFLSDRLPMARAARAAGFEVHVAANLGEDSYDIEKEGFSVHPVRFARGSTSLWRSLRIVLALRELYRRLEPAIIHCIGLDPCMLSAVALTGLDRACVYSVNGSGYPFGAGAAGPLRRGLRLPLRVGINRHGGIAVVQNPDDRAMLIELGAQEEHIALIPGSGIDADRFRPIPEPDGPVTVAYVGQMRYSKGLRTLMQAHRMVREAGADCELLLASTSDPASTDSIPPAEVAAWAREPAVTWLGKVGDVATVWRRAHIAVLASYREGLPKNLLEAAACGRPLIATDVPGCREIVIHEKTGLLVPVNDPEALADAILRLGHSSALRVRLGVGARRLVDERFSADLVGKAAVALYRRLLDEPRQ
jgi:glycosyltransferase involved in cell wall biosynthesis